MKRYRIDLTVEIDAMSLDDAYSQAAEMNVTGDEFTEEGDCILTAENIATEDDCTTHDHEPPEYVGRQDIPIVHVSEPQEIA